MAFSRSFVAGNGVAARREWTPEESARFEFELCRLLATDRGAQSVYFRKLSACSGRGVALTSEGHGSGTASGIAGGAVLQTGRDPSRRGAASAGGTSSRGCATRVWLRRL